MFEQCYVFNRQARICHGGDVRVPALVEGHIYARQIHGLLSYDRILMVCDVISEKKCSFRLVWDDVPTVLQMTASLPDQ